ncbi:MAG: hypothetical protein AAGK23_02915 [Pseudomonadota bacterium]
MSFRAATLGSLIAAVAIWSANAQVEAGGLDAIDPWGFNYLAEGEAALPETFWAASNAEDLLPLMRRARTRNLTPAERILLRRVILSPSTPPGGDQDDDLLAERARLMFEIGEAAAAARFMPALSKSPTGLVAEEVAVDLQLALGQHATACANTEGEPKEGAFWAKLRAVCFVLQDNTPGAELAVELAIAEGVDDPWFFNAIFAASGDAPGKPPAKFDSGLALALSSKAELTPPINAIASSRADLAAAMASRETLPPDLRVLAAGVAAESGLLDAEAHRATYKALLELDAFDPRTPLEFALQTNWTEDSDLSTRARTLREALTSARGNVARYAAVARLLQPDVNALPQTKETVRYALDFAKASLAAGDIEAASRWTAPASFEDIPAPDAFEAAWLDGLILIASTSDKGSDLETVVNRLFASGGGRQRDAASARLFALWSAFDLPLTPAVRTKLASAPQEEKTALSPLLIRSIHSAAEADAAGEVFLRTLQATSGDPYALRAGDLAQLIDALRSMGAEDVSRTLALEASGYWRAQL